MGASARLTVSEPQKPEQTQQSAPSTTGGVSHTSAPEAGPVRQASEFEQQPIAEKREDIRGKLAGGLTILLALLIAGIFVSAIFGGGQWTRIQEVAQIAFGTVAALVASIVGFYFGSHR
jgi:hypothetical protein